MLQKKEVAIAAPLPSAERVVTTAASVPISVDGVIAVEEKNTAEGGFGIPLEIVDGKWENVEEAAPTYCCTAVDHYEQIELVVEEVAVDEGGKSTSTSTILEVENVCQARTGLGLLFLAAAVCLLGSTRVLQSNRSTAFRCPSA